MAATGQRLSEITAATGATAVSYNDLLYDVDSTSLTHRSVTPQLVGARENFCLNLTEASISNTGTVVMKRWTASSGAQLRVNRGGITNSAGGNVSSLYIRLHNATTGTDTTLITDENESGDPLQLIDIGGNDVRIEIYNGTGGTLTVIADISCEIYVPGA